MTIEQLRQLITDGKDQEVTNYLEGLKKPTPEGVKAYLETDEGARVLEPFVSKRFDKGLETWKTNNLDKIIEEEIKKRFPDETEEQKRLRTLEKELEKERAERIRGNLRNQALSEATKKGLPIDLVDHFVGQDEEDTAKNLAKLERVWSEALEQAVQAKFKELGRVPHNPGGGGGGDKNPWSKEHFNLTEQARILKQDPELANTMRQMAR